MAELEVVKHTKNVLALASSKEHALWHRVREIALEIGIIIFAVTVSIWLHGVSEHRHEQEKVRTFLTGLREDMRADIKWLDRAVKRLDDSKAAHAYLQSLDASSQPDPARFDAAVELIAVPSFGVPMQRGRYEGFKSSGKLGNIEDEVLLKKIVEVYEYAPFAFGAGEQVYEANRQALKAYVDEGVDTKGSAARLPLVVAPKGKRLLKAMVWSAQGDYRGMIEREQAIIADIDKLYPEAAK